MSGYEPDACPRAEEAAQHLVNLLTHPRENPRGIQAIISVVKSAASAQEGDV